MRYLARAAVLLATTGCDDHLLGLGEAPAGEGWCGMEQLLATRCVVCHGGASAEAGLDLETDPHAALVGVQSRTDPGWVLVAAGEPALSFLTRKLTGDLGPDDGVLMPPTGPLDAATLDAVERWIAGGASGVCEDPGTGTGTGTGSVPAGEGWCGVQQILVDTCTACHRGPTPFGDLDLDTDPHAALVGVPSQTDPAVLLVDPGRPDASFLVTKVRGAQAEGQGGVMPPTGPMDPDRIDVIVQWVADGASDRCDETITGSGGYHPDGFADPAAHGPAAKLQVEECVDCHGADLTGDGTAPSCDTCHAEGWRTDCVYCHGGDSDPTGAPPRHLSGADEGRDASFVPHSVHVLDTPRHEAWDCTTCHRKPVDVLTPGHVFVGDETAGGAEVDFSAGASPRTSWNGATCSASYCHGSGRGHDGEVGHLVRISTCDACHPDLTSGRSGWERMSGEHAGHLLEGVRCEACHAGTTSGGTTIVGPELHVNGVADVVFGDRTMSRVGDRCTGVCHSEQHEGEVW